MEIPGQTPLNLTVTMAGDQAEQVRLEKALVRSESSNDDHEALEKSAREFEGVFLNTLLKAMRQTVPTNDLFNGDGATKFYRQMHDAEIARSMANGNGGMGIADMIVRQLSREADLVEDETKNPVQQRFGPPAPAILERYRTMELSIPETATHKRLALLAAGQGTAVADTLNRFSSEIETAASASGLDPALILSVVMEESGGDPQARSPKGALGLMQLMPATARELGVEDRTDAAQNLDGGARYLADMLEKFRGKLEVALAAYNAGPGTVSRLGGQVPDYPETRRYVKNVLERYENLGGGTHLATSDP